MPDQALIQELPAEDAPTEEASAEEDFMTEGAASEQPADEEGGEGMPVPAVFPLDPDWILMLLFAILVDIIDVFIIILGFLDIWSISSWISLAIDIGVAAVIGGWMFWRIGEMVKSKKQRQEALVKKLETQAGRLKKLGKKSPTVERALAAAEKQLAKFARPMAKVLGKVGVKAGISVAGETGLGLTAIPVAGFIGQLVGLIPFWTISVFLMLRERGE